MKNIRPVTDGVRSSERRNSLDDNGGTKRKIRKCVLLVKVKFRHCETQGRRTLQEGFWYITLLNKNDNSIVEFIVKESLRKKMVI